MGHGPRQHPRATATGPVLSCPFCGDERGGGKVGDTGAAGLGPHENSARQSQDRFQPVGVGVLRSCDCVQVRGTSCLRPHDADFLLASRNSRARTGVKDERAFQKLKFFGRHAIATWVWKTVLGATVFLVAPRNLGSTPLHHVFLAELHYNVFFFPSRQPLLVWRPPSYFSLANLPEPCLGPRASPSGPFF